VTFIKSALKDSLFEFQLYMWFYFLIFLLIALFSLAKESRLKKILFICTGVLLFLIAAFRGNIDHDYNGYVILYNKAILLTSLRIEPTFLLISFLIKHLFNNVLFLFIIYALLGVYLKFYAIKNLTEFWFLAVLIYFSNFYILHEMTQIRVGIASAFILLSIRPLLDRNFKSFLFLVTLAILFHYSAILALPLYFLKGSKINVLFFALIIPVVYLLYFLHMHITFLIDLIPIPEVSIKFHQYKYLSTLNNAHAGNVFNYLQLSRCCLAFLFLWKWELLQQNNKYSILLLKIYIIAISILVLLSDIPAIGARASELIMPVEILLIPSLMYIIKQKQLATIFVIAIGLLFLSLNVFYSSLLHPYFS
jgi:hypothetical protein